VLWLECELDSESPGGDHTIAVLRIITLEDRGSHTPPLVFHGSSFKALSEHIPE
jgi:flavin reductase (DIM6/NTAB) family NADH-FMN oxidoreductase RutF